MKLKVMFNENKKGVDGSNSINRIVKIETTREGIAGNMGEYL